MLLQVNYEDEALTAEEYSIINKNNSYSIKEKDSRPFSLTSTAHDLKECDKTQSNRIFKEREYEYYSILIFDRLLFPIVLDLTNYMN